MLTGRVVRFDEVKGYGFITPDIGGEDVFVHANMLGSDKWALVPGVRVEFEAVDSERGPKALMVRVLRNGAPPAPSVVDYGTAGIAGPGAATATLASPVVKNGRPSLPTPATDDGDDLCDVLSERAFVAEATESLLGSVSDLTAAQVVAVREVIVTLARRHGWVEDD